jgi:DNA-directed RNA polymerase subunit RPC12/RpoP
MPKKLDDKVAEKLMLNAGFKTLEPYSLIKNPWKSKCLFCGNICHPTLDNIKAGKRGCVTCGAKERGRKTSIRKRMPRNELDKILKDKYVQLLSNFISTKEYLEFKCLRCGNKFSSQIRYIQKFKLYGCPDCRKAVPKIKKNAPVKMMFKDVKEIAESLGFKTKIKQAHNEDLIEISCIRCNSLYSKKLVTLKSGNFICKCAKQNAQEIKGKKYIELAKEYAKSRNGKVLTNSILRKKDRITWECSKGHRWEQSMGIVVGMQTWCSDCAGQTPRTLEELQKIAISRGGKVISTKYINVDATYEFECSLGHKFSNTFNHVVRGGQWCGRCNKGNKSEEICRTTFEQLFGYEFPTTRPKWLRNSRNNQMEIDGYCDELKIGFEYQGIQHFNKQIFGKSLDKRIEDDEQKARLCEEYGIHLFIIDYLMEYSDFPKEILRQATKFGMDTSKFNFTQNIDMAKAYIRDDRLPILKELLSKKKITVMSTKWLGVRDKYNFRCDVCGHEWEARGNHFFNTRRVGGCKKCSMAKLAGSNRLNLKEIQAFAQRHGGKCLSYEYGEIKQYYKFKCAMGHEFEDIYNNMKFRNRFCPTCEGRTVKKYLSDNEAEKILSKYNLKPNSQRPKLISQGWSAICLVCNEEVSPSLKDLLDRGSPCKYCSGASISEKKARVVFAKAQLEPIEPFKSGATPWKSRCLKCGSIVKGRYSNLSKGQGGCRTCYNNRRKK